MDCNALPKVPEANIGIIQLDIFKNAILLGFGLFVTLLFFQKKQEAPRMYVVLLIANTAFSALILSQGGEAFLKTALIAVVQACIWIPYLCLSTRVKATFGSENQTTLAEPS